MIIAATGLPFDDIRKLMRDLPLADRDVVTQFRARDAQLTKPPGSLGKLETMAEWVSAWQGNYPPKITRPVIAVFAGNHGVVAQGVAAYPAEVTKQMVLNFQGGGAAINQICKTFDLGLKVFELALENPTKDITQEPAMDEADCAATMAYGMEAIAGGCDLLCIGEMGIGNTTIAAAICHGLYGGKPEDWVGPGTGVDAEGLKRKAMAVARAVALHSAHLTDPLEVLRRLGGRELAAMAAQFWPREPSAYRFSSMVMWPQPLPPCSMPCALTRSTIAWRPTVQPSPRTAICSSGWARNRSSIWACVWGKHREQHWRRGSSKRRSTSTTTWPPSPAPASPARETRGRKFQ